MAMILVAEDEYLLAIMLHDFLNDAGHEIEVMPDGKAALAYLKEKRKPDLLISDYMMPLMNGAELAQAIRENDDVCDLPILLISGAQAHIGRGRPDLSDDVLDKPYGKKQLMEAVDTLLRNGRGKDRATCCGGIGTGGTHR